MDELKRNIAENGGDRLERLTVDIRSKDRERLTRQNKAQRYAELVRITGESPSGDESGFLGQRQRFLALAGTAREQDDRLQNDLTEHGVSMRQSKQEHDGLITEITSLKTRRSNIPAEQMAMRAALCKALNLSEADMPFAGELLQVRDDEREGRRRRTAVAQLRPVAAGA